MIVTPEFERLVELPSSIMDKKILLGCYEVPGYGGVNTAGYKLVEMMQRDGLDVCYLNLIHEREADYFKCMFGDRNDRSESKTKKSKRGIIIESLT
jgi:hypothetical protein